MTIVITGPVKSGKTLVANQIAALLASQGARVLLDGVQVLPNIGAHAYSNMPQAIGSNVSPLTSTEVTISEKVAR